MKTRLWVIGVVLLVVAAASFSLEGASGQAAKPQQVTGFNIMYEPAESLWIPKSHAQLHMVIERFQQQLSAVSSNGPLAPAMISKIADVFGESGTFTTPNGMTLRGKREIGFYLESLFPCHKISDFKIEIVFVYAKEFTETFKNQKSLDEIVHSVYYTLCISFALDGQACKLPGSGICDHLAGCPCAH